MNDIDNNLTKPLSQEDLEAMLRDNGVKQEELPPEPAFFYSLVLAEVIFKTAKGGINSQRCQLFSKADVVTFPADRLAQLQNSAAHQVQEQVQNATFKAVEVVLLNILPLGWMTDAEFWGGKASIPGLLQTPPAAAAPPEVHQSTNNEANVVPLHRT